MNFKFSEAPVTESDLAAAEKKLRIRLPAPVRALYLKTNGGRPLDTTFLPVDTVIGMFLPLSSERPISTLVNSYEDLVRHKELVPRHFCPFAYDGGGDYFFVDTKTEKGDVYFYDSQDDEPIVNLDMDFDTFWASLTSGEDELNEKP
jgi:hypothetical protein